MAIEIKAPAFPESIADGEVAAWHKAEGEAVSRDELIVEIETDKVVLEVVAPADWFGTTDQSWFASTACSRPGGPERRSSSPPHRKPVRCLQGKAGELRRTCPLRAWL